MLLVASSAAQAARELEPANITLRYKNAPLSTILKDVARATGEVFIADPALPGRFTITIPRKVTKSEALAVLEAALVMKGYATLVSGSGARQVLQVQVASSGSPWNGPVLEAERPYLITTMVFLEAASAENVLGSISHLIGQADKVVAYPPSNSLILTGSERRVRRIIELATALDSAGDREIWVRTIRHRGVEEVSDLLTEALGPAQASRGASTGESLKILADIRSNSLIVLGTDAELARVREFVDEIDQPLETGSRIHVVRIFHRDVEDLSNILAALAIGRAVGARTPELGEDLLGRTYVVFPDTATNSLVIDADRPTFTTLSEVIAALDRSQPRIQVDVIAYEVSNPKQLDLGFDWFLPVVAPNDPGDALVTVASNPSGGGLRNQIGPDITFFGRASRDPLLLPFVDSSGNPIQVVVPRETVVVTANDRQVHTRVLLRPRLLMTSGEEQRIFAGQNVPILTGSGQEAAATQSRQAVERQDVGVELRVTPTLGEAGMVFLDLRLEVSRVSLSVAGDPAQVGPTLDKREMESKIRLPDGGLAVIGMSQEAPRSNAETGIPFLKDIPVLGLLAQSASADATDVHLVFSVQVRILRNHDQDLAESIRQRLALERSQSRVEGLSRRKGRPYAVLVSTRSDAEEARVLAEGLEREGAEVQIGRWKERGKPRFDVYLTGYGSLELAAADALDLRERGFGPQVVVLPGETELAAVPAINLLGSRISALEAAIAAEALEAEEEGEEQAEERAEREGTAGAGEPAAP